MGKWSPKIKKARSNDRALNFQNNGELLALVYRHPG